MPAMEIVAGIFLMFWQILMFEGDKQEAVMIRRLA